MLENVCYEGKISLLNPSKVDENFLNDSEANDLPNSFFCETEKFSSANRPLLCDDAVHIWEFASVCQLKNANIALKWEKNLENLKKNVFREKIRKWNPTYLISA